MSKPINEFLDPKHRGEVTVLLAGVFTHGLLASAPVGATYQHVVENGFNLAREFLKAAEHEMGKPP